MKWYWKVRIYSSTGLYHTSCIETERFLHEIDTIQDFYFKLTGCKMLLEGMSETPFDQEPLTLVFNRLWQERQ